MTHYYIKQNRFNMYSGIESRLEEKSKPVSLVKGKFYKKNGINSQGIKHIKNTQTHKKSNPRLPIGPLYRQDTNT